MPKESRWSLKKFFRFYESDQQYPRDSAADSGKLLSQYDWNDYRMIKFILALRKSGDYTVTYNAFRPDLISLDIYRSVEYWQILLIYNDILSVDDLKPGVILKYPSREDLEYSLFKSPNPRSSTIPSYKYDSEGKLVKV